MIFWDTQIFGTNKKRILCPFYQKFPQKNFRSKKENRTKWQEICTFASLLKKNTSMAEGNTSNASEILNEKRITPETDGVVLEANPLAPSGGKSVLIKSYVCK